MSQSDSPRAGSATTRRIAVAAACYALVGGVLTLAGWAFGVYRLCDWLESGIRMKVNASLGIIVTAVALLLVMLAPTWKALPRLLGPLVALLGVLTLLEHLSGADFGIDNAIFPEAAGAAATTSPGRMGPPASTSFLLLGTALVLGSGSVRARRLASGLATTTLVIAALSLIGYAYGVSAFYGIASFTGISLQMATLIAALAVGVLTAIPEHGLTAVLLRDDLGGAMFRRLLFPVLALSVLLGWLRVQGQAIDLYDSAFGTAARTLIEMILLVTLLWWTANGLSRQARATRESEARERAARLEAETANRLKDQFLATISHELRAPLNAILGWLHLLRKESATREMVGTGLEVIERNARVQSKLIADLLDVSRIVSGKLRLEPQLMDLATVVESAIETVVPTAEGKGIALQRTFLAGPFLVRGDGARLQQVVSNLLSNAVKFTPSNGRVDVALQCNDGHAEVRVRDSGQGIRAEFLPHVFDPFRQEDAGASRAHGGLGLGLSIVKQLVELHGGTIEVESAGEGQGATFTVRVPLAPAELAADEDFPSLEGLRVLVVDDEKDAREVLSGLLTGRGARVVTAPSGSAALEAIRADAPDLMLSDLAMPELDGYGLLQEVRVRGYDLPAIAVTAFARPEDRERALRAGYQGHLAKPIEPKELFAAVATLVKGR